MFDGKLRDITGYFSDGSEVEVDIHSDEEDISFWKNRISLVVKDDVCNSCQGIIKRNANR